jgi:hypothetical protein
VVNDRCRCVGIVSQADIALQCSSKQVSETVREISRPLEPHPQMGLREDYFYCGQPHEMDQILLLNRRRELTRRTEVLL